MTIANYRVSTSLERPDEQYLCRWSLFCVATDADKTDELVDQGEARNRSAWDALDTAMTVATSRMCKLLDGRR